MTRFKVVSVDMFRTLVDLASVENRIWPALLGDNYSPRLAEECGAYAGNSLFEYMPIDSFLSCKAIFAACFRELFAVKGLDLDSHEAANVWAAQHPLSPPFDDSPAFLNAVRKRHRICLASDTDDDMLGKLKEMCVFDHIFTSEQLGCYKAYGDGRFFRAVVDYYGVSPGEILHVGDGVQETVGAKKAGLVACWLNRRSQSWSHDVKPDFEVNSLTDVASLLGLDAPC